MFHRKSYFTRVCLLAGAATLSLSLTTVAVNAGALENMERERAFLIKTLLDPVISPPERFEKIETSRFRLIDMERMVLRDDELIGRNTPTVRRAFRNYDLTFLIHAAAENNTTILEGWLTQLGVTTEAVRSARIGRR
jgi:hypothetical protein